MYLNQSVQGKFGFVVDINLHRLQMKRHQATKDHNTHRGEEFLAVFAIQSRAPHGKFEFPKLPQSNIKEPISFQVVCFPLAASSNPK